jgi:WD40 repeat protein
MTAAIRQWETLGLVVLVASVAVSCQVVSGLREENDSAGLRIEKAKQFTFNGWASEIAFSQKGNALAIAGCQDSNANGDADCSDGILQFWNLEDAGQHSALLFPDAITALAISPDGSKWALGDAKGRLIQSTATSGLTRKPLYHKDRITALAFSPDGKWVASGSLDPTFPLGFMDVASRGVIKVKMAFEPVSALAFSPDGKDLAVGTIKGQLVIWPYSSRSTPVVISSSGGESHAITSIAFSADGHLLAYSRQNGNTVVMDRRTGVELSRRKNGVAVSSLAFAPDSLHLAVAQENGKVIIFETQNSQVIWTKWHIGPVSGLAYSPDGASLAVVSQRHVYLYHVNGRPYSLLPKLGPLQSGPEGQVRETR